MVSYVVFPRAGMDVTSLALGASSPTVAALQEQEYDCGDWMGLLVEDSIRRTKLDLYNASLVKSKASWCRSER